MSNSPVIVRLMGRLGNQLFQYAVGRTLADRLDAELLLDYRGIGKNVFPEDVALYLFNIRAQYLSDEQLQQYPNWQWKLSRALRRKVRPSLGFYHEVDFTYDAGMEQYAGNKLLSGFWQSFKYIDRSPNLLADLTLRQPLINEQQDIVSLMAGSNSVAIHARRGDYVQNTKALEKHGICSVEYYQRAVAEINSLVENPRFFVFSDDPKWVRQNLDLKDAYFVSDKGFAQEIDLILISKCKHQIIANSSFSWWGAFLNDYPQRNVIVPAPWFDADINADDLSPPEWLQLAK